MLDTTKTIELLRRIPVFARLSDGRLRELSQLLLTVDLKPGEHLFNQNDPGASMALLMSGLLTVRRSTSAGDSYTVGTIYPGEVVGEMACIDPAPRNATVTAVEPSLVFTLTAGAFDHMGLDLQVGVRSGICEASPSASGTPTPGWTPSWNVVGSTR